MKGLDGETYPVEKSSGVQAADNALSGRANVLFMGITFHNVRYRY